MVASKIACIGEGMVVLVPETPGPLEISETFSRGIGGAELNVAIGLAALGMPVSWLSRVGDDGFGRHITETLAARGVDTYGVEIDRDRPTGLYVKEVGASTDLPNDLGPATSRMHYYRAGSAASALSPAYLNRPDVIAVLDSAQLVHTTGITAALSPSAADLVASLAGRRPGQLLSVDANWRPGLWRDRVDEGISTLTALMRGADAVLLGALEAQTLLGTTDPDEVRRMLPEPRWLVMKNDENAATGFDQGTRVDVPALSVEVVEAIGAGDAFAAGFLAGLVGGAPLEDCLASGHRLAIQALVSTADHA